MATELETLKEKKKKGEATAEDLVRLKQLQDGEPLSEADLAEAKKREDERKVTDKAEYKAKKEQGKQPEAKPQAPAPIIETSFDPAPEVPLDQPPEHPRIVALKEALRPFTQLEAHSSRPDEFVLLTRGVSITAGDVRKAQEAMKL